MKVQLLFRDRDFDRAQPVAPQAAGLLQDLELESIVRAMAAGDRLVEEVSRQAVLAGMRLDATEVLYRQAVLRDALAHPALIRQMYALAGETLELRKKSFFGVFARYPSSILHSGMEILAMLVAQLRRLRQVAESHASAFSSDGLCNLFAMLRKELPETYLQDIHRHLAELRFKGGVLESAQLGPGAEVRNHTLRRRMDPPLSWWMALLRWIRRAPDDAFTFRLHERDEGGARILSEIRDRGLNEAANALAQSADHILLFFEQLRTELAFYVGALNLHETLAGTGTPTVIPGAQPPAGSQRVFEELRDVSLVLAMKRGVVGNRLQSRGQPLVVVTGANQGGKSSFLRSVGQAQLMMQCGLFVAAAAFEAPVCSGVFTHFRREEDAGMRSGKFDEELSRMRAITDGLQPGALLLFNESFAATNEREGTEVAKGIVRALFESGATVFFVTHMFALAQALREEYGARAVFLRALRRADGTRPFKLAEGAPGESSHAQDLYLQIFGAGEPPARQRDAVRAPESAVLAPTEIDHHG